MAFVPASRMADHPNHWWTSKIRGKCAGKRPGKARELALAKPNLRSFWMANEMCSTQKSMKFGTCWHVLMWKSWTMKIENQYYQYCIPLFMWSQQTRSATVIFSMSRLGQCPGTWKKRFFDCCNLDRRLARTWHNPSNELKGESVAGTLLAEMAEPGTSRRNWLGESLEPSGT